MLEARLVSRLGVGSAREVFMAEHTPGELSFLTGQLAAPHQLGIKTETICNQQLLIGGRELVCVWRP